jgi:hypothetical protein
MTAPRAHISAARVISAVHHLGDRYSRTWPTEREIARHLDADEGDVRTCLHELWAERMFRPRVRGGRRCWSPWDAA